MKKYFILCLAVLSLLATCTFEASRTPEHTPGASYLVTEVYYECYEDPYWHMPEWCDLYDDAQCCTWYIDGWYEEWCDWDYDGCWEYFGSY